MAWGQRWAGCVNTNKKAVNWTAQDVSWNMSKKKNTEIILSLKKRHTLTWTAAELKKHALKPICCWATSGKRNTKEKVKEMDVLKKREWWVIEGP